VPLWLAPKLALYLAMRDQGVRATKAEKIQAALVALGKQLTIEVRDAA